MEGSGRRVSDRRRTFGLCTGGVWAALFLKGASPLLQVPLNVLLGTLVAVISFLCSIGNVPMAAVLWVSGISFGGVLSFLYADLIVIPLLDVYRRYYGWRMAAYIAVVFYITMVLAGLIMDVAFSGCPGARAQSQHPRRADDVQLQLYLLAQSGLRRACLLFRVAQPEISDGSRASWRARRA